ncbi:MAG: EF-hand domain-containing protein [Pseudomonadota bacterium]
MKENMVVVAGRLLQSILVVIMFLTAGYTYAEERDQRAIVEANFKAADADGNGRLNPAEFRTLIDANADSDIGRAAMIKRFGAYDRAFKALDQDGDGSVAWSEISRNAGNQEE